MVRTTATPVPSFEDILGRIERCAMEGASITYLADEDVPEVDRRSG